MAVYVNKFDIPDPEHIPDAVLEYVIRKHQNQASRCQKLYSYYTAKNAVPAGKTKQSVQVIAGYPRYIVDTTRGLYLGEPVKYQYSGDGDQAFGSGEVEVSLQAGKLTRHKWKTQEDDISAVVAAYDRQTIADSDSEIGKLLGIYGEAYELEYASDDPIPVPKTVVCDPRCAVMVRDNSVEHHKLFFLQYEEAERLNGQRYYIVYVYTALSKQTYTTDSITSWKFMPVGEPEPHFFGEVPAVEYSNNSDRLGDFETVISLIDAYNTVMSDRCTDKQKFVDAILALYGADLTDQMRTDLKEWGMLTNLPTDAKLEYIQKAFDESSVHILADDLVREIHKQSMTVDMTDESFAGNSSGQALKLKLLTMQMLVKNKIRSMERVLRKRFEMYNRWLAVQGVMDIVDKNAITPVFTISMPINEAEIVSTVRQLQGIVDDETLLGLLWFVRDPAETLEKVKKQKEAQMAGIFGTVTGTGDETA